MRFARLHKNNKATGFDQNMLNILWFIFLPYSHVWFDLYILLPLYKNVKNTKKTISRQGLTPDLDLMNQTERGVHLGAT